MFCTLFLSDDGEQLTTYEMFLLLEKTYGFSPRLQANPANNPPYLLPPIQFLPEALVEILLDKTK